MRLGLGFGLTHLRRPGAGAAPGVTYGQVDNLAVARLEAAAALVQAGQVDLSAVGRAETVAALVRSGVVDMSAVARLESAAFNVQGGPPTSGLQAWWDAKTLSTLWQDSTGSTTPVAGNGDPVGHADDRSGAGRHISQSNASRKKLYQVDGIATGYPGLQCDDIDDCLTGTGLALTGAQTLAIVYRLTAAPAASEVDTAFSNNNGTAFSIWQHLSVAGYKPLVWRFGASGTAGSVGIDDALDTSPHRMVITYNNGGSSLAASYTCTKDGTTKTVGTTGNLSAPPMGISIGARPDASAPSAIVIGEVLVYNTALTGSDLTQLLTYLASRWP